MVVIDTFFLRTPPQVTGPLSRSKRQINAKSQRLADTWVSRSADGEPELNFRDYSTEEGLVSSRRGNRRNMRRRPTTTEEPLVRNNEDETFYSTRGGRRFQPSGLKEIHDRLPPLSSERPRTRSAQAPELRQRSLPPVRRIGQGRDQVSARVMNYDEDKKPMAVAAHFVADVSNFTSMQI